MAKLNATLEILTRYGIAVIVSIITLAFPVFYIIFRPLTVFPVFWLLRPFYNISLKGMESFLVAGNEIVFIDACIAGSAYALLFLLNTLTRDINLKKRIFIFLFDALILLILNILRLIILIVLLVNDSAAFDFTHKAFWYILSTIFVVAVWFFSMWLFKIKTIPFFSDVKFLFEQRNKSKLKLN